MGLLTLFSRSPAQLLPLPRGSFTVDADGRMLASTLPHSYPEGLAQEHRRRGPGRVSGRAKPPAYP